MSSENVRYFYHTETDATDGLERIVTVAYTHDRDTGNTRYGAVMFRKEAASECFTKKGHRSTALGRFNTRPVRVRVNGETLDEVEGKIRNAIRDHRFGVAGRKRSATELDIPNLDEIPEGASVCFFPVRYQELDRQG